MMKKDKAARETKEFKDIVADNDALDVYHLSSTLLLWKMTDIIVDGELTERNRSIDR
jgi:hypothetical protein